MRRRLVPLLGALLGAACATSPPLELARDQLRGGDAEAALATLAEAEVPSRDRLLLLLDRGLAAHAAGRYRQSIEAFAEADALLERLDFVSVSEQGAALVVSDRVTSYRGESAERLWLHTFQMLNYLVLGEPEGAAVEARRALAVLERHRETLAADAVTRLLIAMSFEAAGQVEAAGVEYRRLVAGGESVGGESADGTLVDAWLHARRTGQADARRRIAARLPEGTLESLRREHEAGDGALVVAFAEGFVPPKLSADVFVSPQLRVAFPRYAAGPASAPDPIEVRVNGALAPTTVVRTNLAEVARAALAERAASLTARQAARAATKYNIAHSVDGRYGEFAAQLLRALFLVLERADTRGWETLPATLALVRIPLPPGRHDVELRAVGVGPGGRGALRATLSDVTVRARRRTFRSVRAGVVDALQYPASPD